MAQLSTNTCPVCGQAFMTDQMLRSHVCPCVNMANPQEKQAYIEGTQRMHREWAHKMELGEAKPMVPPWKEIRDALEKMSPADREIFLWNTGVPLTTDRKLVAMYLAEAGYKVADSGEIYYDGFPTLHEWDQTREPSIRDHSPFKAGSQSAAHSSPRGSRSWLKGFTPLPVSFGDQLSAPPTMSGGVSFQWADGPERTSDVDLKKYIREIGEQEDMKMGRYNELERIVDTPSWRDRLLVQYMLAEGVAEEDLYPERFEGEEVGE